MKQKLNTYPNLLDNAPQHQAAIAAGSEHYLSWTYNVIDKFKSLSTADIKEELRKTALPFAVCMEHVIGDFNMGTVIRNANAFNAREVFYVGNKRRDRRSEVGVSNYTDIKWLGCLDELIKLKDKYQFIGIDNIPGAISIADFKYEFSSNKEIMFIFGEEGVGLTPTVQSYCDALLYIEQYGSVRSLNVGTASGIIFFDFASKYKNKL